jgi:hypothetical protein
MRIVFDMEHPEINERKKPPHRQAEISLYNLRSKPPSKMRAGFMRLFATAEVLTMGNGAA